MARPLLKEMDTENDAWGMNQELLLGDSSLKGSGAGEGISQEPQKSPSGILIFIFGRKKPFP